MRRIIVSFTSYPARIQNISRVIKSVQEQDTVPDRLILYLYKDQFQNVDIPSEISNEIGEWFEIRWCDEDLKSHKKYYYALRDFPEDYVITIDDDIIYPHDMITDLISCVERFPGSILARRAYVMSWKENGDVASYNDWYYIRDRFINESRMDIFPTSGGGMLIPPNVFGKELFDKDVFMKCCEYADDVWLKMMSVISGIPVTLVKRNWNDTFMDTSEGDSSLFLNHNKDGGNDRQLNDVSRHYEIDLYDKCHCDTSISVEQVVELTEEDKMLTYYPLALSIDSQTKVFIYGTGIVGSRFYKAMCRVGNKKRVAAFVETECQKGKKHCGLPVYQPEEITDESALFVIGVSGRYKNEVVDRLRKLGIREDRIVSNLTESLKLNPEMLYSLKRNTDK